MTQVITIDTPELGDRSHLVHDGDVAVAIDPQRDIDRVVHEAVAAGVEIIGVAETHLHNDYVSGGLELAQLTGATHVVAGGDEVAFPCTPASAGGALDFGHLRLRVLATPGHTPHHVAYSVCDSTSHDGDIVFTGGSLLFGTVGRTDLVAPELTEPLTREQYRSAHLLVTELADQAVVYPTHGFGSFCSSTPTSGDESSSIGREHRQNLAFTAGDEDAFVKAVLSGLSAYPRYYAHMGAINRAGPRPIDLSPPSPVDPMELRRRIKAGEWVVDLRERRAFAAGHMPGSVAVELDVSFSTYLGWTAPWGTPITLIGHSAEQVARAQRDLARIGIDRPAGVAVGEPSELSAEPLSSYPVSDFEGLRAAMEARRPLSVLDVRSDEEWQAGRIDQALHIHLPDLDKRLDEVPTGEVWVHCATGYRASMAASLLDKAGRQPVLVDDDWETVAAAGLLVVR